MFFRREAWGKLTRAGIPALFVIRPMDQFTPEFGAAFPAPDAEDKIQVQRTRQLYEQRRLGVREELDITLAKLPALAQKV